MTNQNRLLKLPASFDVSMPFLFVLPDLSLLLAAPPPFLNFFVGFANPEPVHMNFRERGGGLEQSGFLLKKKRSVGKIIVRLATERVGVQQFWQFASMMPVHAYMMVAI